MPRKNDVCIDLYYQMESTHIHLHTYSYMLFYDEYLKKREAKNDLI